MFANELRALTNDQLIDRYEDLKETLYKLRLNRSTGELVDTSEFRKTRRDIARVMTVLRERDLAAALAEEES